MNTKSKKNGESLHARFKNMADDAVALQILEIIDHNQRISQNKITAQTGLAAGLVHSFMRKIIKKGWVKANQVSARRWLYYLTPDGFLEKSRLTLKYFSVTLQNYRETQNRLQMYLSQCTENEWSRLVVAGVNDLAEIAALNIIASKDLDMTAIIGSSDNGRYIAGYPVLPYDALNRVEYDKILVCEVSFLEWWGDLSQPASSSKLIHLEGAPTSI